MKYVYLFHEGNKDQKDLLGGKGANLAEMTNLGLPVPPGFTITTQACNAYTANNMQLPDGLMDEVRAALKTTEDAAGKRFGDPDKPLLVSVRSGAKFSMPGMMDTVLNLGLNAETLNGLIAATNDERFAYDAYRRFVMMFSDIVLDLDRRAFDRIFDEAKKDAGVKEDWQLTPDALKQVVVRFKEHVKKETGDDFPEDPMRQLEFAIRAVFNSWNNERARRYREIEKIPHDLGTAVNVQTMVFGNMGADSGTGVAFTRDSVTGKREITGEYLVNAQGEDVVAGIRTPSPIGHLRDEQPKLYEQFDDICNRLEQHFRDMLDVEFTFEQGRLYFLQCRVAKRATRAAVTIAVDMVHEGLITKEEAIGRVTPQRLDDLLHPQIDPRVIRVQLGEVAGDVAGVIAEKPALIFADGGGVSTVAAAEWLSLDDDQRRERMKDLVGHARFIDVAKGLPASPGAAAGIAIFDPDTAAERGLGHGAGERVILVREETSPDDIHGMTAAQGILTERGGMSSHAALVARGFGKPCVSGCEAIKVDEEARSFSIAGVTVPEGQVLTIDGSNGSVMLGAVPTVPPEIFPELGEFLGWADETRRLKVRANADTPADAQRAVDFGAQGIGLCRTEHMFLAKERLPIVREMLLNAAEAKAHESDVKQVRAELEGASGEKKGKLDERLREAEARMREPMAHYLGALEQILPMQQGDFEEIFRVMAGKPVTIRLIDPPMHEFLPDHDVLLENVTRLRIEQPGSKELADEEALLARVNAVREQNPMLGLRGCRLGILYPEINEMQVKAIFRAALKLAGEGIEVLPEVMIPLVGFDTELRTLRDLLEKTVKREMESAGRTIEYQFGTMIEVPRAAITAGQIAETAEFFSFGTNDLTQTTLAFSRDDAEGKFLGRYMEMGILKENPFETIDQVGVGHLMRLAVAKGREARRGMKMGICGEHGGEPKSVEFFHTIGLDYVSCSPFRVPIARLAAAQAALRDVGAELGR
ncbi:MAG TPA: putative PEP-binding protein [Dehalococcoidia bacterium]|nr:putative PEP-binding protein [Dehalococcoidia bacterium]